MAGLYIHIPFCHSKCAYCDFFSTPRTEQMADMADAVVKEFVLRRHELSEPITTVYLGGGTPSIMPPNMLQAIVGMIGELQTIDEFTIEANPEDVTADAVAAWKQMGINRVSMGVQSLVDSELQLVGRRHTAQQAIDAVATIRDAGIDNISLDLIYGLPNQTLDSWRYSLERTLSLRPEHFSAYILSYEPRTRLTAMLKSGKISETPEETIIEMYDLLISAAKDLGYNHYEISNFALPGKEAKHNSSYWDGTPYLGLGPSAHSYTQGVRRANPADLRIYLDAIGCGRTAYEIDDEDDYSRFNDLMLTALRTSRGLCLDSVRPYHKAQLMHDAAGHIADGSLIIEDGHLRIPESRWLISDTIFRDLIQLP